MIKVGVISLGCSKNLVDSENMIGMLKAAGYELTPNAAEADALIVNTCGFIEPAKQESVNTTLEMAAFKAGKCTTLVMTGCLSQRYRAELEKELPEVDIFLGVNEYDRLVELLNARYHKAGGCAGYRRVLTTPPHYAYLRIADGCDNRCSYCAIPLIRGNYKSRPFDEIINEAQYLTENGVKELNVIAQDTTRYGTDIYGCKRLPELLEALCATKAEWVRLLYTYPSDITPELLDVMTQNDKIVKYIDMPVQHVNDELCARMNRRGTRAQLEALIADIRSRGCGFVLRTTFITGFPGETGAQFLELKDFMLRNPFERAGVFMYSPEDGTPACAFEGQIEEETKKRRLDDLMRQQNRLSLAFNERRVGTQTRVLIDGMDEKTGMYVGRSYAEAPDVDGVIYVKSARALSPGSFVDVRLSRALEYDMAGEQHES